MKNTMTLSLVRLKDGDAQINLVYDGKDINLFFSYTPCDTFYELLHVAINLNDNRDFVIDFFDFPNDIKSMEIKVENNIMCKIKVSNEELYVPKRQFQKAILRMFDKYTYQHSIITYEREWHHLFPQNELIKLRSLVKNN